MAAKRAIVLSDLHLGPKSEFATFRDEPALTSLFQCLAEEPGAPTTELVLAGDLFDFLLVEGYDGFDASRSVERFEAILTGPRTKEVIAELGRLVAKPGWEVTLLSGNHDPELLIPEVRDRFEKAIGRSGSVRHADDEPLRPEEGDRPAVWGRSLGTEDHKVWVVHGDRWDPINMIDRSQVARAVREGQHVELPAGSHLVFEVLARLREPWTVTLKPEMTILPLLLYLAPAETMEHLRRHHQVGRRLLRGKIEARLRTGSLFGGESTPEPEDFDFSDVLADLLAASLTEEPERERGRLLTELDHHLRGGIAPPPGTLAPHGGVGRFLQRAAVKGILLTSPVENLAGSDSILQAAARYLPENVCALVAGHTHHEKYIPGSKLRYVNSGTWLPVGALPSGSMKEAIDHLESGKWQAQAEAPRTFVEARLDEGPPDIQLCKCDPAGKIRRIAYD